MDLWVERLLERFTVTLTPLSTHELKPLRNLLSLPETQTTVNVHDFNECRLECSQNPPDSAA